MKKHFSFLLLFVALFIGTSTFAQTKQATVKIEGEVTTPLTIDDATFKTFTQTDVTRKDRDGKDHVYSGVILSDLLQKAGATMGQQLRGENLTKYILVEASDGYQVVFALAELDASFTDRKIILANKIDGQPLAAADGPYRIIVQDEKKPARCIKQVTAIKVVFAK